MTRVYPWLGSARHKAHNTARNSNSNCHFDKFPSPRLRSVNTHRQKRRVIQADRCGLADSPHHKGFRIHNLESANTTGKSPEGKCDHCSTAPCDNTTEHLHLQRPPQQNHNLRWDDPATMLTGNRLPCSPALTGRCVCAPCTCAPPNP